MSRHLTPNGEVIHWPPQTDEEWRAYREAQHAVAIASNPWLDLSIGTAEKNTHLMQQSVSTPLPARDPHAHTG